MFLNLAAPRAHIVSNYWNLATFTVFMQAGAGDAYICLWPVQTLLGVKG